MTPRELMFAEAYARTRNAKEAYIEAGYSPNAAAVNAHRVLEREHVQDYISQLDKKIATVTIADAATVVNGYAQIAFATPFDVLHFDEDSGLWTGMSPDQIPDQVKPAIKQIKTKNRRLDDGTVVQDFYYELYDKLQALDKLGKHFHVFEDTPTKIINLNSFQDIPTDKLVRLQEAFKDAIEGDYQDVTHVVPDAEVVGQEPKGNERLHHIPEET